MKLISANRRKKADSDDGMIPLINIVFLMLIFFMVVGHISRSSPVKVSPPQSVSDQKKAANALKIAVNAKGKVAFDYQVIQQDQLGDLILKRFNASQDKNAFNLLIKVDQDLPVEKLRAILSIIKKTGIKHVALATQKVGTKK